MVVGALPLFGFTIAAILSFPPVLAYMLAYANFRKRVGGVYFSIITLALSAIMAIMIIGQQGVTGGINGITDFRTLLGISLDTEGSRTMYIMTVVLLLMCAGVGGFILQEPARQSIGRDPRQGGSRTLLGI